MGRYREEKNSAVRRMKNTMCCGGVETKHFTVILTYVEITSSSVNCMLKNLREGKSRSGKGY